MDLATFRASVAQEAPPSVPMALQALWWDAKGDWNKAHACAQAEDTPTGAAVHAYLHRKEPDLANAGYWYNRAGRSPATSSLDQEWEALAQEFLGP
jgi:hypothetical protein